MKHNDRYISQKELLLIGAKKKPIPKYVPKRQGKKKGRQKG
jgi:hypothetical protein